MVISNLQRHGQLTESKYTRWCAIHNQEHGVLYPCKSYNEGTLKEIEGHTMQWRNQLSGPDWCKKQTENGMPEEAISIFKVFAGIDH